MRRGGKSGPAVIPGNPEGSLLYRLVSGDQPAMPMQGEPLRKLQIEAIKTWISAGAPWTEQEVWWSLKPLRKPMPPTATMWARTPVDAFIQAKLREKGLRESPEADRRTLIRRLTYDLHGLPPSPEEVDAFDADASSLAYEKLVDRLLASPRYGERWGRHWLDAAHYGESHATTKTSPAATPGRIATGSFAPSTTTNPTSVLWKSNLLGTFFTPTIGRRSPRLASSPPVRGILLDTPS